jgi:predicted HicB family RNase H-like nuclease
MKLSGKHRVTLEAIFADPVRSTVSWSDVESLFRACGAEISEGQGSRVRVALRRAGGISSPAPAQGDRQGRPEIRPALPDRSGDRAVSLMSYKGYEAVVEYDPDADLFHGEVINLRDVVTFQGRSVTELKRALRDSVEDYIAFCNERGEAPEKPFSGQFIVRVEPALHRAVVSAAKRAGVSLNKWVARTLERAAG